MAAPVAIPAAAYVAGAAVFAAAAYLMTPSGQRATASLGEATSNAAGNAVNNIEGLFSSSTENAEETADEDLAAGNVTDACSTCEPPEEDPEEERQRQEEANEMHDNIEEFEGRDFDDVERELDRVLRDGAGWRKQPLRNGEGWRYTSPNGARQIRINRGYPQPGSDYMHSGPYIARPSTGTRIILMR